jgi:hypothetical protein
VQRLRVRALVDLGIRSKEARYLQVGDVDVARARRDRQGRRSEGRQGARVPFGDDFFKAFIGFVNRPIPNVRMTDARGTYREARKPLDTTTSSSRSAS